MKKNLDFDEIGRHLREGSSERWDTDASWTRLSARMREQDRRHGATRKMLAIAALLVIGLGSVLVYFERARLVSTAAQIAGASYQTGVGERRTVRLADGTEIDLAPLSTLRVEEYDRKQRIVHLDGEAFFNVIHDVSRPFTVRAARVETRVLGTSFNVAAYRDASAVEVVVSTGSVQVMSPNTRQGVVLKPGQAGRVTGDATVSVREVDVADPTAWRTGQLSFRDVRFEDVTTVLGRWYGVQIEIPDRHLANAHVTILVPKQSLDNVLQLLAETLNARYVRDGSHIRFYARQAV